MSKYIIKNCENLLYCTSCKEYECAIADDFGYKRRCSDNNNCNLKQIIELCGKYHIIDVGYQKVAINYLSSDILKLLDIQEVE
jgi:hypothetical protein